MTLRGVARRHDAGRGGLASGDFATREVSESSIDAFGRTDASATRIATKQREARPSPTVDPSRVAVDWNSISGASIGSVWNPRMRDSNRSDDAD